MRRRAARRGERRRTELVLRGQDVVDVVTGHDALDDLDGEMDDCRK
jgi:hypothetical protein